MRVRPAIIIDLNKEIFNIKKEKGLTQEQCGIESFTVRVCHSSGKPEIIICLLGFLCNYFYCAHANLCIECVIQISRIPHICEIKALICPTCTASDSVISFFLGIKSVRLQQSILGKGENCFQGST